MVDVDAESAKLAANALEHQAAVQVAHAAINVANLRFLRDTDVASAQTRSRAP